MTGFHKGTRRLSSGSALPIASAVALWTMIGAAEARDLCANIDDLIDQSRSQFTAIMGEAVGDAGDHDATLTLAGASYCSVFVTSNKSAYHCVWEFPYRAQDAYDTFDGFVQGVNECIGQHATVRMDQSVNHPDYYASHRYEVERAEVSISVKDKSAMERTFVFIRVQGAEGR